LIQIREACRLDLLAITEIYNYAILNTTATMDTEIKRIEQQIHWLQEHFPTYPVIVALYKENNEKDTQDNAPIVGWASLSKWSDRVAYAGTVEISVYVKFEHQHQGIGSALIQQILIEGKQRNFHTIIARIAGDNAHSIYLHKKFGFKQIGIMREVGFKFGEYIDVSMYQILL
jgi:L-amino acid N-acyltransferase YncA